MVIYDVQDRASIAQLFLSCDKTFIQSYFQGYMGKGYVDDLNNPKSALIIIGEFYFFAGTENHHLASFKPSSYHSNFAIMVPPNQQWATLIEKIYASNAQKITRYAFKNNTLFDINKLEKIVLQLPSEYQLKLIDNTLYQQILLSDWGKDLCANFKSYKEFKLRGIGVVALKNDIIVAGASSYAAYKNGIEIEVDTKGTERRKGLALICSAKLIMTCLDKNIYPNWDAHNEASLNLAQKLGYHLDKNYFAYIIGYCCL
ncbi:GNAT family N-acetyltransferase [Orbus wheelerorum]|uniref:GNAT family N-acetyltransferase n=1 Tax=Orbus wheelerorum TaxID=3074111 RepID=UPI00370DD0EB